LFAGCSDRTLTKLETNDGKIRITIKANEITGITNSVGAAWAIPTYDAAGNMAGIPNPQLLSAQYDAWNRLVWVSNGAKTVNQHRLRIPPTERRLYRTPIAPPTEKFLCG